MKGLALSLALLVSPLAVQAQSAHPQTAIIDGSKHPESIPDSTAYRLYFITVANMTPHLREAQLVMAGLSPSEIKLATQVLEEFKRSYDSLSASYNQTVDDSERIGVSPDVTLFVGKRDALVAQTRASLHNVLTQDGRRHFDAHVQGEKKQMKSSDERASN